MKTLGNKILVLNITSRCNMNCPFCFGPEKDGRELSIDNAKNIIDKAVKEKVKKIVFTGGEPLLCSYIYDILEYAKDKGLYVILHTNGLLLSWSIIKKLESLINQINLPLDGYDERTNSIMRLPGHFGKIMKLLALLKNTRIRVIISTVATLKNKYFIEKIEEILPDFICKWRIFQFKAEGKAKRFGNNFKIEDAEFKKIVKEIKKKKLRFKVQFVSSDDREFEENYYII